MPPYRAILAVDDSREPRKTVASGSNGGREAELYRRTASIGSRQCNAQQVIRGYLKELVEQRIPSGKLERYSLAYINPAIFAGDNGRVLGYDNAHGYPHRHFMGMITPEPALSWEAIRDKFEREWRQIAMDYVNGGLR